MRQILKTTVVAQWIIILVYAYVLATDEDTIIKSDGSVVESLIADLWTLTYIISSIGLFFIKLWAIKLYIILFVLEFVLWFFTEPTIENKSDLAYLIGNMSLILNVLVVTLCLLLLIKRRC